MLPIAIFMALFVFFLFLMLITKHEPRVIGWIPYWEQASAVESFKKNVSKMDYISVFWYRIDENGNLGSYKGAVEDRSIIDFAHKNGVLVLALVANLSETGDGSWDYQRVDNVISTKEARSKHIKDLVELVEKNGFDGIDIDYESLRNSQKEDFAQFIKELSEQLHLRNKILGVAIHPKTSEDNPLEDNGSQAQDLRKIARHADQLYFMTYLEHGAFGQPGPIGSLNWMDQVIRYGLTQVPYQKAYLGIGLMGAAWTKENGGTFVASDSEMAFLDVLSIAKTHNLTPIWDDKSKTPYLEFQTNGAENIIWFENAESIKPRLNLAEKYRVGGVAFWRLGGEDERIWKFLK